MQDGDQRMPMQRACLGSGRCADRDITLRRAGRGRDRRRGLRAALPVVPRREAQERGRDPDLRDLGANDREKFDKMVWKAAARCRHGRASSARSSSTSSGPMSAAARANRSERAARGRDPGGPRPAALSIYSRGCRPLSGAADRHTTVRLTGAAIAVRRRAALIHREYEQSHMPPPFTPSRRQIGRCGFPGWALAVSTLAVKSRPRRPDRQESNAWYPPKSRVHVIRQSAPALVSPGRIWFESGDGRRPTV